MALLHPKDAQLHENYVESVRISCLNLHFYIIERFPQEMEISLGGMVNAEDAKKAAAIFNNLSKLTLPPEQQVGVIMQILGLDPYQDRYYTGFAKMYPDEMPNLLGISDFFGAYELRNTIIPTLTDFVRQNIGTTEESANQCRQMLDQRVAELNISPECAARAYQMIDGRLAELDRRARLANGDPSAAPSKRHTFQNTE